ncbi:hypothetical protein D3C85_1554120 [compost metagenome]
MRVGCAEQRGEVGALAFVARMDVQPVAMQRGQFLAQGHAGARSAAVVERIVDAQFARPSRHRADRRHANAAGDEDRLAAAFVEPEMVARATDAEPVSGAQHVMHPGRAAPAVSLAQHGDLEGACVGRIAA